jgi:ribosome-interacting GTPase 1
LNLDRLSDELYAILDIIRVYTRAAGKKEDLGPPYTVRSGATVVDMAEQIHKDFVAQMKFAKVWGSAQFDGQQVQRDYVLADGDIVEIHT